MQHTDYEIGIV